jgi:hypothetical protein
MRDSAARCAAADSAPKQAKTTRSMTGWLGKAALTLSTAIPAARSTRNP